LKSAYQQLELHPNSREITTFITPQGLYRYKRLLCGVNSAPEIFQKLLEERLAKCPNALNYIDDVIVFGSSLEEHDKMLEMVKVIFKENNIFLKKDKCVWKTQRLKFLGHILSDTGISADPEKVQVITAFRPPKNKEELRSFLGLVTYVGRFLPDLADTTEPLRKLLKADEKFLWNQQEQQAFDKLKIGVSRVSELAYFNVKFKTRVIADASPVALGAVLIQFDVEYNPFIISFAS